MRLLKIQMRVEGKKEIEKHWFKCIVNILITLKVIHKIGNT